MKRGGTTFGKRRWLNDALSIFGLIFVLGTFSSIIANHPTPNDGAQDEFRKLIKQARKLVRADSLSSAEKLLQRAVALQPERSEAKVELGYVFAKQRRLLEAYKLLFPIAQAEPTNARAFAVLGFVLLSAGRFDDARQLFLTAVKLNRRESLSWAGCGILNFYLNKIDDSLLCLQEAVYRDANQPDYWFVLGQVYARAERFKEAADAYNRFLIVAETTDVERRTRIKGLIDFLRFIGQHNDLYASSGKNQTSFNFDLVGNRPIINVKINGNDDVLRFVIDTGSGITVISDATAKKLRIKPITRGGFAKGIGGDGRFEIVYGFLKSIELGDVSIRSIPVYIREFHNDQQPVDGYIGLALISKFLATIDYGNNTFSLTKRSDDDRTGLSDDAKLTLPLRLTSSGFLSGEVQLEGIESPLNFIVDTGASVSVISQQVAKIDSMLPFANDERLRVIGSAGVTDDVPTFVLPKISFGPHSEKQIFAVALNLDLINEASGFEQAGILGGNFLKNYKLTFDFKNSKVQFVPVRSGN